MLGRLVEHPSHHAVVTAGSPSPNARSNGTRSAAKTRRDRANQSRSRSTGVRIRMNPENRIKERKLKHPQEWKLVALRDCPLPESMQVCDTPERAADYWRTHVVTTPHFDREREC